MTVKKVIKNIIKMVAPPILNANHLNLDEGYKISEDVFINKATLRGKISVGKGCKIVKGVMISGEAPIRIGRFTSINGPGTEIYANINPVEIGSFCSIARQVSVQEYNHQHDRLTSYFIFQNVFREDMSRDISSKGKIIIGNDVWIGANVSILSGVKIGHGAVVAANSVVTKDILDYAIVAGSPAKIVKMRFDSELIDRLLEIRWWNWSLKRIKNNREVFSGPLTMDKLSSIV